MTCPRWGRRGRDLGIVILDYRLYGRSPCGVEGYPVLVDLPSCREDDVPRGHGRRDRGIPTGEGVSRAYRIVDRPYGSTEILGDRRDGGIAGLKETDRVLVYGPLRPDDDVRCGDRIGDRGVPSRESVSGTCRIGYRGDLGPVIPGHRGDLRSSRGIEGYRVLPHRPLGSERHRVSGHARRYRRAPSREPVSLPHRNVWHIYRGRVGDVDYGRCGTVAGIECRRVTVHSPPRGYRQIGIGHPCRYRG